MAEPPSAFAYSYYHEIICIALLTPPKRQVSGFRGIDGKGNMLSRPEFC
jgi:hypothetical protein